MQSWPWAGMRGRWWEALKCGEGLWGLVWASKPPVTAFRDGSRIPPHLWAGGPASLRCSQVDERRQEPAQALGGGEEAGSGDSQLVIPSHQAQLLSPVVMIHGGSVRWRFFLFLPWSFLFPPGALCSRPLLSAPHLPY